MSQKALPKQMLERLLAIAELLKKVIEADPQKGLAQQEGEEES